MTGQHHPPSFAPQPSTGADAGFNVEFDTRQGRVAPLAWGQQRVARLTTELSTGHAVLNVYNAARLRDDVTIEDVAAAVRRLIETCESLRSRFHLEPVEPYQEVLPSGRVQLGVTDAEGVDWSAAFSVAADLASAAFEPDELPVRLRIVTESGQPRYLALALSHLATDFLGLGWILWHLRDVLADLDAVPRALEVTDRPLQPCDLSEWETSPAGRAEASRAMSRHSRSLSRMPQSMRPALAGEQLDPRYEYVELTSRAAAWCLNQLSNRHRVSETAVAYAVLSLILARSAGLDRAHLQLCVSNRGDRRIGSVVSSLTQDVPTCIDMLDDGLEGLLVRSAGAVAQAVRTGRFPPAEIERARRDVEAARRFPLDLSFWLNSRLTASTPADPPTRGQLHDELAKSSIRRVGGDQFSTSTVFTYLDRWDGEVSVRMLVDTAYVRRADAQGWLRAIDLVLSRAVLDPETDLTELITEAGVTPAPRNGDWAFVDHSWIHLPTTADRMRSLLSDDHLTVVAEGPAKSLTLVALVSSDSTVERASRLGAGDLDALRDCKVAMLPHAVRLR
jgi:hypothetical protein